jgi:outer membrane protein TolC
MRIRVITIFCLLLLFSGSVYSQTEKISLTFEQALEMSYSNNSIFKQNELLKKEKAEERKAALGLYLPQISLSANYMYLNQDLTLDMTPVRDAITPLYDALGNFGSFTGASIPGSPGKYMIDPATGNPFPVTDDQVTSIVRAKILEGKKTVMAGEWNQMIQKQSFATLSANVMWPLYAGGKIRAANDAAKLRQTDAEIQAEQNTFHHINEMVERYYGLCLAYQVKTVREDVYSAMKNHLGDAEKMYKAGVIAKVQYLHAKVFYDDAERELKKAVRQVNVVKTGLANTLGIENTNILTVSSLFYIKDINTLDYYKAKSKELSPILKLVENKKMLATLKFKLERSDMLPSIAAIGVYDIANKDLSHFMPEYMLGLGLKWNIFGGQRAYRKTKAAKLTIRRVSEIKDKYSSDINAGITKYYESLQMYIEQLDALETSMSFANEYYSVREKSFKEGMATSTELVDANLAVTKVQIERLKVLYDFDVCLSKLLELSGLSRDFVAIQMNSKVINEEYKN